MNNSPLPITLGLPVHPYEFDIFSYPDISERRSQVESRLINPSYCLTNIRVHATQKGFFGCDAKAFLQVSAADNNVLNRALLVEPLPDKQSVAFALKVFSIPKYSNEYNTCQRLTIHNISSSSPKYINQTATISSVIKQNIQSKSCIHFGS